MTYVVYHIKTTVITKWYDTERAAKAMFTRYTNNPKTVGQYAWTSREDYDAHVVTKKLVKNLMTGKMIEIPSNTPRCCDPSTEAYWSM